MKKRMAGAAALAVVVCGQTSGRQPTKPVPPPGIDVPAADRAGLEAGLKRLDAAMAPLKGKPLLPDVLIYREAVRYARKYHEFFTANEIAKAKVLLKEGEGRAAQLAQGQAPWATSSRLVVRGYVSKIDGSVQPYGLVLPPSYSPNAPHRWRLDTWFHGRGETLSEVNFLADREKNIGEFAPRDTIMLHLYGRFCNASQLAGETDLFEALDAVKRQYAIDDNRILIRGFSMGGASAWHFGVHFAGLWAAVAPGAGFSETVEFLHLNLNGPNAPSEWERQLFHMYDATDYAANLYNVPTIAYNGEIDPQKQAADAMEKSMAEEGLRLIRIVGPQTPHRYHPESKVIIERMLDQIAERGRDAYPRKLKFTTWTLQYNQMKWLTVDAMNHGWERARLNAEITADNAVHVDTANVAAFSIDMGPAGSPLDPASNAVVVIDGQRLSVPGPMSDRSWSAHFRKSGGQWAVTAAAIVPGLHKQHGLQGPVDDGFLSNFVFVTPTGPAANPGVANWVAAEQQHAITEWRRQFRGEALVKKDSDPVGGDGRGHRAPDSTSSTACKGRWMTPF